ncbi:MAG TPA: hypothetical protein VF310_16420 [Vicinamibacteria bacterium]
MTRRQGRWLATGGAALAAWAGLASLGGSPWLRAGLAPAMCLLVTVLALASTAQAVRRARSTERIFWALLSLAAALGGIAESLAALGRPGPAFWSQPLALVAGAYLPTALGVAALLLRPHRSRGVTLALAALDGLLIAGCAGFFISYGLLLPEPRAARALQLAADAMPLVQSLVLALAVRDPAYRRVYRLLAAGFGGRVALGALMLGWAPAHAAWATPYLAWSPVLVFLALAGLEPAEGMWIATTRELGNMPIGRMAVFLVALPALADVVMQALQHGAPGGAVRSQLAMAATALLAVLAAVRVHLGAAAARAAEEAAHPPADEESGRFLSFAAGVAHQVNNRLNIVAGWSQVALRRSEGDRPALQALVAAAREASDAAAQFQWLAAMRGEEEEP